MTGFGTKRAILGTYTGFFSLKEQKPAQNQKFTERAKLSTFRAGPRGLSTQSSLKCLFVCLFVCLFIFPHKCTIGDKSLQISKQYPLHEQKLLVPPDLCTQSTLTGLFVCLFVCLFIFPQNQKSCTIGDKSLHLS